MIAAAIMRQAEQRIFRCDRFRRNGVQSGSGDLAAAQGFGKGGAGHKVAAGSVDDENAPSFMREPNRPGMKWEQSFSSTSQSAMMVLVRSARSRLPKKDRGSFRSRYHHLAPTARLHSAKRRAAFIPLSAICSYFICGASFCCRVDLRYSSSVRLTTELAVLESASLTSCSSSRIALVRLG